MTWKVTSAERRALDVLERDIPRHPADLFRRDRVRFETLRKLSAGSDERPALARRMELKPSTWLKAAYFPFYVLTAEGEAARKALAS